MKKITVSAPGKLMLLGEHAVVYGRPCIVTAVGQRMKATVELTEDATFQLNAPDVQVTDYKKPMDQLGIGDIPKGAKFVEIAVKNFFDCHPERLAKDLKIKSKTLASQGLAKQVLRDSSQARNDKLGVSITTASEFSSQFGFGSSSASTVCVIKALSELTRAKLKNKAIFELAYKTVLDIQGKGSGFDVAAAVYGGTLYFVIGGKTIKPLKIDSLPLIVGYSGIKADTITLVNQVAEKAKKYPQVINNIYDNIGKLVEQAKPAFLSKDWQTVGELMNFDESYLSALGVEGKKLADMIYGARDGGAYGAKLSGGGIGDCMIALAPEDKEQAVKKGIASAGGKIIEVQANVEGVRIEDEPQELFVVVNRNDQVIDYRTRYDCHHDKRLIHRTIGVVVFNEQGQVLLQKRSKNKDLYPGLFTVSASGHVNKGETYGQTAKRELMEELGISARLKKEDKFLIKLEQETEMGYLFSAKHNGPFRLEKEDIDEVRFVTPAEIKKMRSQLTPFALTNLRKLKLL